MVKTPTPIRGCGPVISALDPWARRIRRSDRLGRMGRGGLDSARQVMRALERLAQIWEKLADVREHHPELELEPTEPRLTTA